MSEANKIQIGGTHYKDKSIEPWDAIAAWGLGYFDGNAVKYLARWKTKGGAYDLRKAMHYIVKLLETLEEKPEQTVQDALTKANEAVAAIMEKRNDA